MNAIIIPAYKPNALLTSLTKDLIAMNFHQIVVIDDGGQAEFAALFSELKQLGCHVLHHEINQGKGAAIKTGIRYAHDTFLNIHGYVTCDADGQHPAADIFNVAKVLDEHPNALILGTRDFSLDNVPRNSRLGNRFSSFYFKLATGVTCRDTQTGLRGIPLSLTKLALDLPENRYDYEMTFLTRVAKEAHPILPVTIATVYLDDNSSSHFRPFIDSIRIYKEPIKFAMASLFSAGIDLLVFTLLTTLIEDTVLRVVFYATIAARLTSGIVNFMINRLWSFRNINSIKRQFFRYLALYITQLGLSIAFVSLLSHLPIHLTLVKVIVDSLLFIGSFFIQKNWVFKHTVHSPIVSDTHPDSSS